MRYAAFWHTPGRCLDDHTVFVPFENTALYSPLPYLPGAAPIGVGRLLNLPFAAVFYLGRLAGLATYVFLVWLALRLSRRGSHVLFVLSLLPTSLVLASTYSADGLTIALSILAGAIVIRARETSTDPVRWFCFLAVTLLALALTKHVYMLYAPLLVLVPLAATVGRRRARIMTLTLVAVVIGVGVVWAVVTSSISYAAYFPPGAIDSHKQWQFIMTRPLEFVGVLFMTSIRRDVQWLLIPGFISDIGNRRNYGSPFPPLGVVVLGAGLVASSFRAERSGSRISHPRAYWPAALPLLLAAGALLLTELGLWLKWTPVGSPVVNGMQGRYFLPLIPMVVVSVTEIWRSPFCGISARKGVILGSFLLLGWCSVNAIQLFY